ncbi:hypothetical protein C8J57DRAFT_1533270 [Mycena rebaudengoi]|nr:hypothetical protein C8J57DRAFT_1533270 [Mycena rebaudengoi]
MSCPDFHTTQAQNANYPEQVWLATIIQNWCPKCDAYLDNLDGEGARLCAETKTEFLITIFDPGTLWNNFGIRSDVVMDIHELLSSDLLHQVIKGAFKDHLISWVNKYLHLEHGKKCTLEIIQDIDCCISAVPEFPGFCRFPDGRDYNQWTGDNSKALMKIYLSTVAGYLPSDMIRCLTTFMDFCYLVQWNSISSNDLGGIQAALDCFHQYHNIFIQTGMTVGTTSSYTAMVLDGGQPQVVAAMAISAPFPLLFHHHLYDLIHGPLPNNADIAVEDYPVFGGKIYVHHGAIPKLARHDLVIGHTLLFFSFTFGNSEHHRALILWLVPVGDSPDPDMAMWAVEPEVNNYQSSLAVIEINCITRTVHLIGVYGYGHPERCTLKTYLKKTHYQQLLAPLGLEAPP